MVKVSNAGTLFFIDWKLIIKRALYCLFFYCILFRVSSRMDDIEEDMKLDKFILDADLLVCVQGSSVLGMDVARAWPGLDPFDD